MGCLFVVFAAFFPRLGVLLIWLARPAMFSSAFGGSWLLPLLGIIVLPFTTLMYVLVWTPAVGVIGWDWMWVGMGFLIDITSAAGAQYANKRATVPA